MNLNLRQIIRNQKTKNFDLISLISEKDEEQVRYKDKDGNPSTMDVSVALKQQKDHPARLAAEKLKGAEEKPIKKDPEEEPSQKEPDQVKQDPENKDLEDFETDWDSDVNIDDNLRDQINSELENIGLKPSEDDENVFVDEDGKKLMMIDPDGEIIPGEDIEDLKKSEQQDYFNYLDDINDQLKGEEEEGDVTDKSGDEEERDYRDIYKTDIAGKDKTLSDVDSLQTEIFTEPITPDDTDFDSKNKKNKFPEPPPSYEMPKVDGDYPQKYNNLIERFVNTKLDDETSKISYFMESSAGAGKISSQAGEILTMAFTALNDDQAKVLESSLLEHLKSQKEADPKTKKIVDPSWVRAAMENREAIRSRITKEYPEGSKIVASAWDVKEEVNALGMDDYENNKGFSTDVYFKVQTPDGKDILDEVSLKKDVNVNFLNSGTKKFNDWDENLSEELDQSVYTGNQRKRLKNFVEKNKFLVESALKKNKDLQKEFNSKGIKDVDELLSKKPNRAVSKLMLKAAETIANTGDRTADNFVKDHKQQSKEFASRAVEALTTNEKLTEGMLNEIKGEFPLKAVSEGEETMAIGPYSLDPAVMKNIFGTNDFEKIKEKLVAVKEDPPYVGYQAEVGGETIPIASIDIREDGVGYGAVFRFDMKLDKRFAKTLKEANNQVYKESIVRLGNILYETKQNTLGYHWKKAEDNYPVHYFIRELNEESLN